MKVTRLRASGAEVFCEPQQYKRLRSDRVRQCAGCGNKLEITKFPRYVNENGEETRNGECKKCVSRRVAAQRKRLRALRAEVC